MAVLFLVLLLVLLGGGLYAVARHDAAAAWRRHVATALAVFDPKDPR